MARDLYETLMEDDSIKKLLIEGDYKIHLGKDYMLKINRLSQEEAVVSMN